MTYYYALFSSPYDYGRIHKANDLDSARAGALRLLKGNEDTQGVYISRASGEDRFVQRGVGVVFRLHYDDYGGPFYYVSESDRSETRYRVNTDGSLGGRI